MPIPTKKNFHKAQLLCIFASYPTFAPMKLRPILFLAFALLPVLLSLLAAFVLPRKSGDAGEP